MSNEIIFKQAVKSKSKLRLALQGSSGSGKTYSALILASSLGEKIAVIDTESGSASLYADKFNFKVFELNSPYAPENYIEVINVAGKNNYDVLIIDSLTPAWDGEGGYLDLKNKLNDSYGAKTNPRHRKLIYSILQSKLHIIVTMRTKTDYQSSFNEKGKLILHKIGTTPIQKEGIDSEFTIVFGLNENHNVKILKDRTNLFSEDDFIITEQTGIALKNHLQDGVDKEIQEPNNLEFKFNTSLPEKIEPLPTQDNIEEIQKKEVLNNFYCADCNKKISKTVYEIAIKEKLIPLCFACKIAKKEAEFLENMRDTGENQNEVI